MPDTEIDVELLITTVQKFPELYDPRHKDYKNAHKKANSWRTVAEQCDLEDVTSVKKKWNALREYFAKCVKEEKTRTGQASTSRPPWQHKEQMEFLRDTVTYSSTESNVDSPKNDSSNVESDEENKCKKRRRPLAKEKDILFCEYLKKKTEDNSKKEKKSSLKIFFEGLESSVSSLSEERQLEAKLQLQQVVVNLEKEELEEKRKNSFRTSTPIAFNPQQSTHPYVYTPSPYVMGNRFSF